MALAVAAVAWIATLAGGPTATRVPPAPASLSQPTSFGILPLAARGPIATALGRDEPAFWFHGAAAGNPNERLRVRAGAGGVSVGSGDGVLRLALAGIGRPGSLRPVLPRPPTAIRANRATYSSPGLRQWYANGPLGVEQGFTVARRPAGGAGRLELALSLSGDLEARAIPGGILFAGHGAALRYSDLVATDARGRSLPARIALRGRELVLSVEDRGARYPVRIDPFIQQAELTGSDTGSDNQLNFALAISGDTIAAGDEGHKVGGFGDAGAVYVFVEPATGWSNATQTAQLTADDPNALSLLGGGVAIDGATIVASAVGQTVGGTADAGAVYVWSKPVTGWSSATQSAELTFAGGEPLGQDEGVALSGSTIVAADRDMTLSESAVYVFSEPQGGWADATQTAELTGSDESGGDQLGNTVGVDGKTIVASSIMHAVSGSASQGAVYVYVEPASGHWADATQTAELTASNGSTSDNISNAAISGTTIIASVDPSVNAQVFHNYEDPGAIDVYAEPAGGWRNATQSAVLTASNSGDTDELTADWIDGGTIVGGVNVPPSLDLPATAGAVDVWREPAGGWASATQTQILTDDDGGVIDNGSEAAVAGDTLVSDGEYGATGKGTGPIFVYGIPLPPASTSPPAISGVARAGQRLSCSHGGWSSSPSGFVYQWTRDGTPIAGATSSTYKVAVDDEQLTLRCAVTASNAGGPSASPGISAGVVVPVPHKANCPAATGSLTGTKLGLARLGMGQTAVLDAYEHSSHKGGSHEELFCLTPVGVRVGFASAALLKGLAKAQRSKLSGRVVWASTASGFYATHGVRVGATLAAAGAALKLSGPYEVGHRLWYVGPNGSSNAIFEVAGGVIAELGIADKSLTATRAQRLAFLRGVS